ncbi:MAG TPA: RNA-binding S4 domain-containing protein [Bacteroidales bacterium]|nr:RNA-binding S4 domain-containing protein [Bacteroidales bacterium]
MSAGIIRVQCDNVIENNTMSSPEEVRIDKFLWAVRVFKSRSAAADACKKGRIFVNSIPAKPSRTVSIKDIITVKKLPVIYTYQVISLTVNRVPAKNVNLYVTDLTPEDEKVKLYSVKQTLHGKRPKGKGRPTKKERREIDRLFNSDTASW